MQPIERFERIRDLSWDRSLRNPLYLQMSYVVAQAEGFFSSLGDGQRSTIYDLGCGTKPYRHFCAEHDYVGVDIDLENKMADVFADIAAIPVDDGVADVVVSFFALEHVREPWNVLAEAHRITRPGGKLFMMVPLYWEEHEQPEDYFRFTRFGMHRLLSEAGFVDIRLEAINTTPSIIGLNIARLFDRPALRWLVPLVNRSFGRWQDNVLQRQQHAGEEPANVMSYAVHASRS